MDDDDREDSLYANEVLNDITNVSTMLQKEPLDVVLRRDKEHVHKSDMKLSWYHGKISREAAESLLQEGMGLIIF